MKEIIKSPIFIITLAITLMIAIVIFVKENYTVEKTYKGMVIEHNTTSDRVGNIDYYTIAIFEDGYVRSLRGLKYYTTPIGGTIYLTIREFK